MPREKFSTLTEQMFCILLCLKKERCGMDIMEMVQDMTGGRVRIGPGTVYNLLEQFQQAGMIRLTADRGRKKSYILTGYGHQVLEKEYLRLLGQTRLYEKMTKEEPQ